MELLAAEERPVVSIRPDDDLEVLDRTRRLVGLSTSRNDADPRMRLRRRLAETPIEISLRGASIHQSHQAWEDYELRMQRAGLPTSLNQYHHFDRSGK